MYAYPKTSATIIQAAVASSRFTQSTSSARESHRGPLRRKRAKWCLKHDMSLERLSAQEVAFGGIARDGNSSELKQMPLDSHMGLDRLAANIRSIELSRPPASRSVQKRLEDPRRQGLFGCMERTMPILLLLGNETFRGRSPAGPSTSSIGVTRSSPPLV